MKRTLLLQTRHGFTLVELIVVMAIFLTVIVIAAQTFNTVITFGSKYSKSEESNIEGIIGLEVLRHDLEQMGFGLFWGFQPGATVTYTESTVADASTNDSDKTSAPRDKKEYKVPRAFVALDNIAPFTSDFLGVKGTTVGRTRESQRWTYISYNNFSSSPTWQSRPVSWQSNNPAPKDKVIAIRNNVNNSGDDHLLLSDASNSNAYGFDFDTTGGIGNAYLPTKETQFSMVYGIAKSGTTLGMPFNRADFFVSATVAGFTVPLFCAPDTGVLYKATVEHDGSYRYIPLLDCVANMQVVLGWDTSDVLTSNSSVSAFSNSDGTVASGGSASVIQSWLLSPQKIREHLKLVKVYILAQEGKRDPGYTNPSSSVVVGDTNLGETALTNTYTFTAAQLNYRWTLYRVIVRPKNLVSNQQ